jgi:hypothetical protein
MSENGQTNCAGSLNLQVNREDSTTIEAAAQDYVIPSAPPARARVTPPDSKLISRSFKP